MYSVVVILLDLYRRAYGFCDRYLWLTVLIFLGMFVALFLVDATWVFALLPWAPLPLIVVTDRIEAKMQRARDRDAVSRTALKTQRMSRRGKR